MWRRGGLGGPGVVIVREPANSDSDGLCDSDEPNETQRGCWTVCRSFNNHGDRTGTSGLRGALGAVRGDEGPSSEPDRFDAIISARGECDKWGGVRWGCKGAGNGLEPGSGVVSMG
jgi:hypothetical protein